MDQDMTNSNPLTKYFRQAAIHMELPSGGRFWPPGTIEIPASGQIAIMPMTARDEITLRTPDALMNGSGIVEVIQSCCPAIKDAWHMPNLDVDAVLIGIRIATYGTNMDFNSECPYCKNKNLHGVDLTSCLAGIRAPDYDTPVQHDGLQIKLRPVNYFGINRDNNINYHEQRMMDALQKSDVDPELRKQEVMDSVNRLIEANIYSVALSTQYITMPDGTVVSDPEYIHEYYKNASGDVIRAIQKRLSEINESGGVSPIPVKCENCQADYAVPLEFDYANFFGQGF